MFILLNHLSWQIRCYWDWSIAGFWHLMYCDTLKTAWSIKGQTSLSDQRLSAKKHWDSQDCGPWKIRHCNDGTNTVVVGFVLTAACSRIYTVAEIYLLVDKITLWFQLDHSCRKLLRLTNWACLSIAWAVVPILMRCLLIEPWFAWGFLLRSCSGLQDSISASWL